MRGDGWFRQYHGDFTNPSNVTLTLTNRVGSDPYYENGTVEWTATCSDTSGVRSVQLYADGVAVGTADTTSPYSGAWVSGYEIDTTDTLTVRCIDLQNNLTNSAGQTVTIDVTAPAVDVESPIGGYYAGIITWLLNIADTSSGVASGQLYIDDVAQGSPDTSAPYTGTRNTSGLTNGASEDWEFEVCDNVDNCASTDPIIITPDNTAPGQVQNVIASVDGTDPDTVINLSWNALSDPHSGSGGYRVYMCSPGPCTPTFIATVVNNAYTATGLTPSTLYEFQVAAVNGAGAVGTLSSEANATTTSDAESMVMQLKFDGDALDTATFSNNGTATGSPPYISGKIQQAISLNGTSQYVTVNNHSSLNNLQDFTIEGWVYFDSVAGLAQAIFDKHQGTGNGHNLVLTTSTGQLSFNARRWTTDGQWQTASGTIKAQRWYHIVVTYSYSSLSNDPSIYINGSSMSLTETVTPAGSVISESNNITLGATSLSSSFLDGAIDNVRLYGRIMTAQEVEDNYLAEEWTYKGIGALTPFDKSNSLDLASYCNGQDEIVDNACMQSWVNDARNQGKHMYASAGTYLYSNSKALHDGVHLQCENNVNTVFKNVGVGSFFILSADFGTTGEPWEDISIENCGFDMNGYSATNFSFIFAIVASSPAEHITIRNLRVFDSTQPGSMYVERTRQRQYIVILNVNKVLIENNVLSEGGRIKAGRPGNDIVIRNNSLNNINDNGITIVNFGTNTSKNALIENNAIHNALGSLVFFGSDGEEHGHLEQIVESVTIRGNTLTGQSNYAITGTLPNHSRKIYIYNNTFVKSPKAGYPLYPGSFDIGFSLNRATESVLPVKDATIISNTLTLQPGASFPTGGVFVKSPQENLCILNNTYNFQGSGAAINFSPTTSGDADVHGNTFNSVGTQVRNDGTIVLDTSGDTLHCYQSSVSTPPRAVLTLTNLVGGTTENATIEWTAECTNARYHVTSAELVRDGSVVQTDTTSPYGATYSSGISADTKIDLRVRCNAATGDPWESSGYGVTIDVP